MRTLHTLAIVPFVALALVACGDDDTASPDTTAAVIETTVAAADATTTIPAPTQTEAPQDTTPPTAVDGPVQIDVVVGTDSGEDRIEMVKLGSDVTLNITNPAADDEFHVHGIELEQAVDAGVTATFNFVADTAGTIEVESHITEDVLVIIEVA
ncbi:MAG: hypothetical protein HY828_08670 [Actinobacteria bacterium]|nr:hypothetical protein [Actinomycetota bacterium]